jgi:hypothetical protein
MNVAQAWLIGDVERELRDCFFKTPDVRPAAMACAPERRAAEWTDRGVFFISRELVQNILGYFVRRPRPARPDAETRESVARARAHIGCDTQPASSIDEQIGHTSHSDFQRKPDSTKAGFRRYKSLEQEVGPYGPASESAIWPAAGHAHQQHGCECGSCSVLSTSSSRTLSKL